MTRKAIRIVSLFLPVLLAVLMAACGGNADGSSGTARIRLLNLSTGYESLDLYTTGEDSDTDTQAFASVQRGSITSYATLKSDLYTLKFRRSGTTGNLQSLSASLVEDLQITYVACGALNRFAVMGIDDSSDPPDSGYATLQLFNISSVGSVDIYLTGANDALDDVSTTVSSLTSSSQNAATVTSGTYRLRVTVAGSKNDVRLNVPQLTLASQAVTAIILTDADGGVLINAVVLPRGGQPVTYENAGNAQVRLLNVSTGYELLDLYAEGGASGSATTPMFSSVALGNSTDYAPAKADTYALKLRRSGTSGNLLSTTATLSEDTWTTFIAYGTTNRFAVLAVSENTATPDPGYTSIQVLNATSSDALDVYLTGSDDSLSDVAASLSAVAAGAQSSWMQLDSGSYRLRITGNGSKTDLRLDVPAIQLQSAGVVSLVLTDTFGGVLVNAILLPQQGQPVRFDNNTVRLRGAVGLSSGSVATVSVAGTELVGRRPARSYFASAYSTLAPGDAAVSVELDDVVVAGGTVTLQAGRDYTLLVWDSGGTTKLSLIPDDNYVAVGQRAKVRLLNGMSGLGAPITLSMDYLPLAEFVETGAASGYTDLGPGSEYRLDLTQAQTLESLLAREAVTLQAQGVYTFFAAGGGGSAVAGTLRKDR